MKWAIRLSWLRALAWHFWSQFESNLLTLVLISLGLTLLLISVNNRTGQVFPTWTLWPMPASATPSIPSAERRALVLEGLTNGQLMASVSLTETTRSVLIAVTGSLTGTHAIAHEPGPIWTADNARVAFAGQRDGGGWRLYVADDLGVKPIVSGPILGGLMLVSTSQVAWAPEGQRLAFTAESSGPSPDYRELFVVALADGTVGQVTFDRGLVWDPIWVDNDRLAFVLSAPDGSARLILRSWDGTGTQDLYAIPAPP